MRSPLIYIFRVRAFRGGASPASAYSLPPAMIRAGSSRSAPAHLSLPATKLSACWLHGTLAALPLSDSAFLSALRQETLRMTQKPRTQKSN